MLNADLVLVARVLCDYYVFNSGSKYILKSAWKNITRRYGRIIAHSLN